MKNLLRWIAPGALLANLIGCGGDPRSPEATETADEGQATQILQLVASNSPLADFARRLGGDRVAVRLAAPPDVDPAYWQPTAEDVLAMQEADLLVLNGAGYEPWLGRVALPDSRIVDTSADLGDRLIETQTVSHQHGPTGAHSHGQTAFTVWLDPTLAASQAERIAAALAALQPETADKLTTRLQSLREALQDLDEGWRQVAARLADRPVLFSHPVYQYWQRRYGLNGRSLHWEPDAHPDEAAWAALDALREEHPATIMIWEAPPLAQTAERLSTIGIGIAVLSPGANLPTDSSYLATQRAGLASLQALLAALGSPPGQSYL